jgi:hypothetical protein
VPVQNRPLFAGQSAKTGLREPCLRAIDLWFQDERADCRRVRFSRELLVNPSTLHTPPAAGLAPASARERQRTAVRRWPWLAINAAALLAIAVWMRVFRLENIPGINGDEGWSGVQALRLLHGESIDWRTPSGNPINVFFFLPLVAMHVVFPPSFLLLRVTSLVSGLLALVVNYLLCRRAFDTRTAIVSTWLLALLPIDIAYSRFAWDASQSLLATLVVMYLPLIYLRSRAAALPTLAMIALVAAIIVHPTNLFAVVLLIVPAACDQRKQIARALKNTRIQAKTAALATLVAVSGAAVYGVWHGLAGGLGRLHGPGELREFVGNYARLFSGAAVYEFISGVQSGGPASEWFARLPVACNLVFGGVAAWALWGLVRRLKSRPTLGDASLVLGWLTMLVVFFVVAGPDSIAPHYERYGICLIAPGALVLARGMAWWIGDRNPQRQFCTAALALAAWLWPLSFYLGYFEFFAQTGGRSHMTFRTASVEPKLAAFRYVLEHRDPVRPTRIVCPEWWNYWPLAYLAAGHDNIHVFSAEAWHARSGALGPRWADNTWFVGFAGAEGERAALEEFEQSGLKPENHAVYDHGREPLLSIIGKAEKSSGNY